MLSLQVFFKSLLFTVLFGLVKFAPPAIAMAKFCQPGMFMVVSTNLVVLVVDVSGISSGIVARTGATTSDVLVVPTNLVVLVVGMSGTSSGIIARTGAATSDVLVVVTTASNVLVVVIVASDVLSVVTRGSSRLSGNTGGAGVMAARDISLRSCL